MHSDFDPNTVDWSFFATGDIQTGGGGQVLMSGGMAASYPVFSGMAFQRGAGIGSVLRSLWRFLLPVGREVGAAIGRQGLESGSRVLSGLLDGKDVKETLVSEGKSGLKNLLDKAANNLNKQKGSGGSNFDFKRYKRAAATGLHIDNSPTDGPADDHIKRRLLSTLGPSTIIKRGRRKETKNKRAAKGRKKSAIPQLKVDALGPY